VVKCANCGHQIVRIKCPECDEESTHCCMCGTLLPITHLNIQETTRKGGTGGDQPGN